MRLLADENFPLPTVEALRQAGHDVFWVRTDAPGTADAALLDLAEVDGRVLLTLDKDFWQIAIQRRQPLERSGVICFVSIRRLRGTSLRSCSAQWKPTKNGAGTPASLPWIAC
jgi:predicted nuclease of predicted toxin-antitoxin system